MTIAPEKRSGAMKAVITGEQMQMELLELLQSLPDDVETEAFHNDRHEGKSAGRFCLHIQNPNKDRQALLKRVTVSDLCV